MQKNRKTAARPSGIVREGSDLLQNALRRLFAALCVCALVLMSVPPLRAQEDPDEEPTAEALLASFLEENSLNEDNFSLCYYNTITCETVSFNETRLMAAASTYKLPLNIYYYDLEREGLLASDAWVGAAYLDDAHLRSLVWSDNTVSEAMIYFYPGSFHAYKEALLSICGVDEPDDPAYYTQNVFSTEMMIGALRRVYEAPDIYAELLDYLKQAYPQDGFFRRDVTEYEVAHKYGYFEGAENDVGIFYTDEPFLLAVYTSNAGMYGGADLCARAARMMTDYNVSRYTHEQEAARLTAEAEEADRQAAAEESAPPTAEEAEQARLAAEADAVLAQSPEEPPVEEATASIQLRWTDYLLVAAGALVITGLGGALTHGLVHRAGKLEKNIKAQYGKYLPDEPEDSEAAEHK